MERDELITKFFYDGYSYSEIVDLLANCHNIKLSVRQLKRDFQRLQLSRKSNIGDEDSIRSILDAELAGSGSCLGYKSMWHRLKSTYNLNVRRETVRLHLKELDPEGVESRLRQRLRRRSYTTPGPNYIWHVDGYDKLVPFGITIHACIDGYSRYLIWMIAASTNKKPEVISHHYLEAVKKFQCVPTILRTDAGSENVLIASLQQAFRNDHTDKNAGSKSYLTGKSTANQRIESFWRQLRRNGMDFYISLFKDMRDMGILKDGDLAHIELLRYCFGGIITQDLTDIMSEWNSHKIRNQKKYDVIGGRPTVFYHVPERYGKVDCRQPVSMEEINLCLAEYAISPKLHDPLMEELVKEVIPDAVQPNNIEEALELFGQLTNFIKNLE